MNQASLSTIKLQAYIARLGISSRRKAEQMIADGLVTVDGELAHIGQRINPEKVAITIDGKPITNQKTDFIYYLVNKPIGYVSTTQDELGRKTVLDLLPPQKDRLYPVGRLDIDSEGLILITNDGNLAQKLTHPAFEIPKTYHVLISGTPSNKALNHLKKGVKLTDGYTKPALVSIVKHDLGDTWVSITIHEGKNRQIRRMISRVGYEVLRLIRVSMADFSLEMLEGKRYLKIDQPQIANTQP